MNVPKNVQFPEFTNPGINAALCADKINETLAFLRLKFPEEKPMTYSMVIPEENVFHNVGFDKNGSVVKTPTDGRRLKPGVTITKSRRYMLNGRLIKSSEAFV